MLMVVVGHVTQEIAAAYEIVGDPDKRAIFDDFGHDHKVGTPIHPFMQINADPCTQPHLKTA